MDHLPQPRSACNPDAELHNKRQVENVNLFHTQIGSSISICYFIDIIMIILDYLGSVRLCRLVSSIQERFR